MLTKVKKPLRRLGNNFGRNAAQIEKDGDVSTGEDNMEQAEQSDQFEETIESPHDSPMKRGPIKFAYSSGSQPLSGFTIKRGVGVGGFGDVYYATSDAGKEVALKRIQRNLDVELRGVRQCLNLKHVNLVSLYDIRFDEDGQAWVVMEYVSGENLQDVIERNPNGMPIDQVEKWFYGIMHGVAYLHDHGIVHRDLKPGNIFIDNGVVKIGDYGLAKFISCSRRSGQTESVGTFHYMAPEIGLGKYGKEIDVYALGILLYEMLTGSVPFEGESSQEIIMKHLTAHPELSRLPAKFRRIVSKALNKDPERRYRCVGELLEAISKVSDPQLPRLEPEEPTITAQVVQNVRPEEPIARALKDMAVQIRQKWQSANLTTPMRVVLTVIMVLFLLGLSIPIIEATIVLGVVYAGYYLIWYLATSNAMKQAPKPSSQDQTPIEPAVESDAAVEAEPVAYAQAVVSSQPVANATPYRPVKPISRAELNDSLRDELGAKGFFQHMRELTGSMLMASVVSIVLCVVTLLIGSEGLEGTIHQWGPLYAWMTISTVICAWSILLLSKFWESTAGDQALRRFCMLATGLVVGFLSSGLADGLLLEPTYLISDFDGLNDIFEDRFDALYETDGSPKTLAYMGYFGCLFVAFRWWLNADPIRSSRMSLFSTAVAILGAILVHAIIPLPKAFLVAATTAIAVQLSAPWIDTARRKRLKKEMEAKRLSPVS